MKIYPVLINFNGNNVPFLRVLAHTEEQVLKGIEKKYNHDGWYYNYENHAHDGYDNYLDYMLAIRGEINDGYAMSEALENSQQYGWDEGQDVTQEDAQVMLKYGVVEDWSTL
jgi:hypothetical protein